MKVSEQDVLHVAELANLELTGPERASLIRDLNSILGYIDRLNQLDTANVPPMTAVGDALRDAGNHTRPMRKDEPRPSLTREAALKNAPETDGTFFVVPKVIER